MTTTSFKPTITEDRYLGRRLNYIAELFGWASANKDKAMAIAGLAKQLENASRYSSTARYAFANDGTVFALRYDRGWNYDIAHPGTATHGSVCFNAANLTEAYETMLAHVADYNAQLTFKVA